LKAVTAYWIRDVVTILMLSSMLISLAIQQYSVRSPSGVSSRNSRNRDDKEMKNPSSQVAIGSTDLGFDEP